MDIHTICLIGEPCYIVYWLTIYFEISSSLLQVALVDPVVYIRCATPVDPVVGASSLEITTQFPVAKQNKM